MAEDKKYPEGIKWTKQRKTVYDILSQAREPISAAQIFEKLDPAEDYALSTVYRILAAFDEHGMVNKNTWLGNETVFYELNDGGHKHYAVCLQCHKRVPLEHCPFMHMHGHEETKGFTVTGHKLEVYGYCDDCKETL